jgi:hypothetical protein
MSAQRSPDPEREWRPLLSVAQRSPDPEREWRLLLSVAQRSPDPERVRRRLLILLFLIYLAAWREIRPTAWARATAALREETLSLP